MNYESKQKKLDNEEKLSTLVEHHQDLRLLKEGILKELQCPRKTESSFLDLSTPLICTLVAAKAKRLVASVSESSLQYQVRAPNMSDDQAAYLKNLIQTLDGGEKRKKLVKEYLQNSKK